MKNSVMFLSLIAALASCDAAPRAVSPDETINLGEGACVETHIPFDRNGSRTVTFAGDEPMTISFLIFSHAEAWEGAADLRVVSDTGDELCSARLGSDATTECGSLELRGPRSLAIAVNGEPILPPGFEIILATIE